MKKFTTLFLISLSLLMIPFSFAKATGLVQVIFESDPLFTNTDTKPGDSETKWIKIINSTGEGVDIGIAASNFTDPNNLENFLML